MNPKPRQKTNQEIWENHYTRQKSIQTYPDENLVRILKQVQPGSALDFGTGSGRHLQLLHELGFAPIYGLDMSAEAVATCTERYPFANCSTWNVDQSTLPFDKSSLDALVAWGVLHYNPLPTIKNLLKEFSRILAPAGSFAGTLRAVGDSHLASNADLQGVEAMFFREEEVVNLLSVDFHQIRLGYMERSPLGQTRQRVCHWFFLAQPKS